MIYTLIVLIIYNSDCVSIDLFSHSNNKVSPHQAMALSHGSENVIKFAQFHVGKKRDGGCVQVRHLTLNKLAENISHCDNENRQASLIPLGQILCRLNTLFNIIATLCFITVIACPT